MRPVLAFILILFVQSFAIAQQKSDKSSRYYPYYRSDSIPPAWKQYEYVEETVENEEFDKPFAIGDDAKKVKRKKIRRDQLKPETYEYELENSPQVFTETEIPVEVDIEASVEKVPANFTGYRVEIVTAAKALPADHYLFFRHGNLFFDQKRNGKYSYMLGEFKTEDQAMKFYRELLESRYPGGRIIEYKSGERIE
ncbi:MAG: hypothetical protein MRY78_00445 [Saprospiraceae bacterium]|nr:hypothetical protein [Saprospiraceae bacterium]